jgi:hypothetical protein
MKLKSLPCRTQDSWLNQRLSKRGWYVESSLPLSSKKRLSKGGIILGYSWPCSDRARGWLNVKQSRAIARASPGNRTLPCCMAWVHVRAHGLRRGRASHAPAPPPPSLTRRPQISSGSAVVFTWPVQQSTPLIKRKKILGQYKNYQPTGKTTSRRNPKATKPKHEMHPWMMGAHQAGIEPRLVRIARNAWSNRAVGTGETETEIQVESVVVRE